MSSCEVTTLESYESKLNKRRVEIELDEYKGVEGQFKVGQQVRAICKKKGQNLGKVYRFATAGGVSFADVVFKLPRLKFMIMIPLIQIEPASYEALEMNLTVKRQGV